MKTQKAAIYVRVSTSGQTVENQERELLVHCQRQGWQVFKVYRDEGFSGAVADRPALKEMMAAARLGRFNLLVVWKIDRLARSISHLLEVLTELKGLGVGFVSLTEAINTETSQGRMIANFLGSIAEFERELVVERVRAGMARAKANNVKIGRPRTAFDYAKAAELRKQGMGYKAIARALSVPRTTVYRVLRSIPKAPIPTKA
ncbi:MAG: hypothetical protein EOM66_09980 [Clostridia bacterium]|nr:hypothetical protein [Clostridia bacterium]